MGECMMPKIGGGGEKVKIGTVTTTNSYNLSVQDLDFKPSKIAIWIEDYSNSSRPEYGDNYLTMWFTGYPSVISYGTTYGITVTVSYLDNGFSVNLGTGYSGGYFRKNVNYKYAAWA